MVHFELVFLKILKTFEKNFRGSFKSIFPQYVQGLTGKYSWNEAEQDRKDKEKQGVSLAE